MSDLLIIAAAIAAIYFIFKVAFKILKAALMLGVAALACTTWQNTGF